MIPLGPRGNPIVTLKEFGLYPSTRRFDEVVQLGHKARVSEKFIAVAACPIDAISLFFTLTANLGYPVAENAEPFVEEGVAKEVLDRMHALIAIAHPNSTAWNPIQLYDQMVLAPDIVYCPWAYGYSNYSRRQNLIPLKFADAPAAGNGGCNGTQRGGTGIAVSKQSPQRDAAVAYAKWLASQEHQCGTYFLQGGQPAGPAAWTDPRIVFQGSGFFSGTLETLRTAYVRPRFDGFIRFFEAAGIEINRCLKNQVADAQLIECVKKSFAERLGSAAARA